MKGRGDEKYLRGIKSHENVKKKLTATEFSQLEELLDLRSKSGSMHSTASFIRRFQLGALMIIEVYAARNEIVSG
ncbi:DUF6809 family protein [Paenibacillus lentus]|uniref:Uncharacterized protein n=1 Tax=Paenibacillus lentus TaxID=1338368 RepID=A0A3Q8S8Q8_9BACL|nr:DUF6809 family protein [Paenibacillus lentus]AZK45028.1 hypothetical protein EIM92_01480 [Paenibacillus lentus]